MDLDLPPDPKFGERKTKIPKMRSPIKTYSLLTISQNQILLDKAIGMEYGAVLIVVFMLLGLWNFVQICRYRHIEVHPSLSKYLDVLWRYFCKNHIYVQAQIIKIIKINKITRFLQLILIVVTFGQNPLKTIKKT